MVNYQPVRKFDYMTLNDFSFGVDMNKFQIIWLAKKSKKQVYTQSVYIAGI